MNFNLVKIGDNKGHYRAHWPLRKLGPHLNQVARKQQIDDGAMVLYGNDQRDLTSHHKGPLYVTTSIRQVKLKRAMTDPRS